MTDALPEPPVPADADLRGYGFMPLYGAHLFNSDFNARASDAGWRAGLTLWWAAWNQMPAGSLPDDDTVLCRLADLGRDMRTWRKIKDEALHGFFKHADGRLYAPFLAKLACDAWDRRVKERDRKAKYRAGRDSQRDGDNTPVSASQGQSPSASAAQGRPRREGQGEGQRQGPIKNSVPSERAAEPPSSAAPTEGAGPELPGLPAPESGDMPPIPLFAVQPDGGDWSKALFRQGLDWLARSTGKPPNALRGLVGTWLRAAQQDHRLVFEKLAECEKLGVAEPVAWMTKATATIAGTSGRQAAVANEAELRARMEAAMGGA
jgi:hypothetical protein